jgi:hypothetical protein
VRSFLDVTPVRDNFNCYVVMPVGGSPPSLDHALGSSDLLCVYPGTRSGIGAPGQLTARLNQTQTATLSWTAPFIGGQSAFLLNALTLDGTPPRTVTLPPTQTSVTDDTHGSITCYSVAVLGGGDVLGYTDTICVVPGQGRLS